METGTPKAARAEKVDPFGFGITLTSDAELIQWSATSAKLAAGPLRGDETLSAQQAFVADEMRRRRLSGPKVLSARERQEMGEGQE